MDGFYNSAADPLAGADCGPSHHDPETGVLNRDLARAIEFIAAQSHQFQKKFPRWLAENWHLWERFEEEAEAVWESGRERYSARTIIEFLRHETFLRESDVTAVANAHGGTFKINNSFVPDVSRLYGLLHPLRRAFFECRELHGPSIRRAIRGIAANGEHAQAAA